MSQRIPEEKLRDDNHRPRGYHASGEQQDVLWKIREMHV
jgi:hypothetical protein